MSSAPQTGSDSTCGGSANGGGSTGPGASCSSFTGHEPPAQPPAASPFKPLQHGIGHWCAPETTAKGTTPATMASTKPVANTALAMCARGRGAVRGR